MAEEPLIRDPARVVAAAYLLALICLLVPFAVLGAGFAGVALMRRNRPREGMGVLALALVCTVLAVTVLR